MKLNKDEIIDLIKILIKTYPEATGSLDFKNPFELGIGLILAAQCTDVRVNQTTSILFKKYNKPEDFVKIEQEELEELIHPCGFYKNKAKSIKGYSKKIISDFNGKLPKDMNKLMSLPGIGRKSANIIMLEAFGVAEGIAVDTHCKRISNRIGLSRKSDPNKIEQDLLKIIPEEYYKNVNHLFVWHGRYTCIARKPQCDKCTIAKYCDYYKANK